MSQNRKSNLQFLLLVVVFLPLFALAIGPKSVTGQENGSNELSLRLNRAFGYGLAGQMQGTFSYIVNGPEDLTRVEFILDGEAIGVDSSAPFQFQFDTAEYASGTHKLAAIGYKADGQTIMSNTFTRQFVPGNSVMWIVIVVVVLVVVGRLATMLLSRSSKTSRNSSMSFGYLGGAVCPSCGHPFGIHWWSLRLGFRRFDRCSNCGKWSFIQRASPESLQQAADLLQASEAKQVAGSVPESPEDDEYQKLLDESRFDDN